MRFSDSECNASLNSWYVRFISFNQVCEGIDILICHFVKMYIRSIALIPVLHFGEEFVWLTLLIQYYPSLSGNKILLFLISYNKMNQYLRERLFCDSTKVNFSYYSFLPQFSCLLDSLIIFRPL